MATADKHCECIEYDLRLMTVNAKGPSTVKAKDRIGLLTELWTQVKPDITAFQEFPWTKGGPRKKWPKEIHYFGNDEALIMFNGTNTKKLFQVGEIRDSNSSYKFLTTIHEELFRTNQYLSGNDFTPLSRMTIRCVVIPRLDSRKKKLAFLLVSLHGKSKISNKEEQFVDTCMFLSTVAKRVNLPFVVAGDFNLNSDVAETIIVDRKLENLYEIKLYGKNVIDYRADMRHSSRVNFIDYFITGGVNTDNQCRVKLFSPRTLNIITYSGVKIDVKDNSTYPLDHDPVMVYVKLCSCGIFTKAENDAAIEVHGYVPEEPEIKSEGVVVGPYQISPTPPQSRRPQQYSPPISTNADKANSSSKGNPVEAVSKLVKRSKPPPSKIKTEQSTSTKKTMTTPKPGPVVSKTATTSPKPISTTVERKK